MVVACYLPLSTRYLTRPGLYFDAVNPDYAAIKILHPDIPSDVWIMPGNLVLDRFPVLAGSLYHGSLQAYFAVPFTYLFGPHVVSVRSLYICEAILICLAVFMYVYRRSGMATLAWFGAFFLAIDPAFVFSFRTQAYIVTFPIFFTILGCLFLTGQKPSFRGHIAAGVFFGLAAWGYFVHLFFLPGVILHLLTRRLEANVSRFRSFVGFGIGMMIGVSPYILGYALIVTSFDTIPDAISWFHSLIGGLRIMTPQPLSDRIDSTLRFAGIALTGEWIWEVVWGLWHTDYGQIGKVGLLIVAPCIGLGFSVGGSRLRSPALLMLYAIVSYVAVAVIFGQRMGGHHFVLLLPLLYILLALSAGMVIERGPTTIRGILLACVSVALVFVNLSGSLWTIKELRDVEGNTFYSDIISNYPLEALESGSRTPYIFINPGGFLPFTYLTSGRIPAYEESDATEDDRSRLTERICSLGVTKLVFLGQHAASLGRDAIERLQLTVLGTRIISTQKGNFDYAVFAVGAPAAVCAQGH
jgi:hypothetical protein